MKFANGAVTRPNDKIKSQKEWIVQIFNRKTQGYKQTDPDKCDFQQPARRLTENRPFYPKVCF